MKSLFTAVVVSLFLCGVQAQEFDNYTQAGEVKISKEIGDDSVTFDVTSVRKIQVKTLFSFDGGSDGAALTSTNPQGLILGYPLDLVGKENVFGGVITKVSNSQNEDLGMLKLSDLPPIHVKTRLAKDASGKPYLVLTGCPNACGPTSPEDDLIALPVVDINESKKLVYVDLAELGKELDIVGLLGASEYFKLQHVESNSVSLDFSDNTLVFDVLSKYKITGTMGVDESEESNSPAELGAVVPDTESLITTRFYLKLHPKLNPNFKSRDPVKAVGYFGTQRSLTEKITRFHVEPQKPIQYYIKNVPQEYQAAFTKSFDDWNQVFTDVLGYPALKYELLNPGDPRFDKIVTGDVRYNVIEWDVHNLAGYGGLGPSIANQITGETLSANILIQGPTVEKLYKEWFGIADDIKLLKLAGDVNSADQLEMNLKRKFDDSLRTSRIKHQIKLGSFLSFRIPAEDPAFQDEVADRKLNFEEAPEGYTYDTYMHGYFNEMVAHEMGHNFGLRHNFKGNLQSDDSMKEGTVSASVMEYLGRSHRHINRIADYDRMAIAYGYKGVMPDKQDWFCTDENVPSPMQLNSSAECSRDDASSDPFGYFEGRFTKMINLMTAKGSSEAPIWRVADLKGVMGTTVNGMALYAATAVFTANEWTNFFGKKDRPQNKSEAPKYVTEKINQIMCDPQLDVIANSKASEEAKQITLENLKAFRASASKLLARYNVLNKVFSKQNISCFVE